MPKYEEYRLEFKALIALLKIAGCPSIFPGPANTKQSLRLFFMELR
jgi:hypothetical protein